jgi:enoyl-[acyl-carrier protein] reductase II|tara:strand:- start:2422 stop:3369 length:948 start_codon:yes stop_codon:yes gene_type:complete
MFRTRLCDLLSIRYPILQGAMQGAGGPELVAAVSNAGGLGVLPTFGGTEKELRSDIEATRRLTRHPFGVNIFAVGLGFTEARARVIVDLEVPIVTTGRGDPGTPIVQMLKEAGTIVIPVVPTVAHALRVEAEGAHVIVASGTEAGGHVGQVATLPLVPQVVDAVDVPVVAAGGIADGRGFLAALALGACGIQLGTRFIATLESNASEGFKQAVVAAGEADTLVTRALTGKPVRTISTSSLQEYERGRLEGLDDDALRDTYRQVSRERREYAAVAGQISGLVNDIRSVQAIMDDIIGEAAKLADELSRTKAMEGDQ